MSSTFFVIALAYWGLLLFWQMRLPVIEFKPPEMRRTKLVFAVLTGAACLFVMGVSLKYTGLRLTLDFINVYDIRSEAESYAMPTIISYLLGAMPLVLSMFLAYWMKQRRWILAALIAVVYLFLFSIAGNKSYFFMLVLVLGVSVFYRKWMLPAIPGLLVLVSVVEAAEYAFRGSFMLSTLFTRRMMFVPAANSEVYHRFFSQNPVNLFRNGIMGKFSFDSIYTQDLARMIGEYLEEYEMNANNGLLGDMFANMPVLLGLLLMPLILVICFRAADMTAKGLDVKIMLPFMVYFANAFINTSWSTVLLTHGFLLACLLFFVYPRDREEKLP